MNSHNPLKTWSNVGLSVYPDRVVVDNASNHRELTLQDFLSEMAERYRTHSFSGEMDEARRYVKALLETKAP
jgi:hypothetical protein